MPTVRATFINTNPQQISDEAWRDIMEALFDRVVFLSPVDTGNYRESWELIEISHDIFEFYNSAGYASFLEDGWSSQAPNGILQEAIKFLPQLIRARTRRRKLGEITAVIEIPEYIPSQVQ